MIRSEEPRRLSLWPQSKSGRVLLLILIIDRIYTFIVIHFGIAVEANPVTATRDLWIQLLFWPALYWIAVIGIENYRAPEEKRWLLKYCFTLMAAVYCTGYIAMSYMVHASDAARLKARDIAKQFVQ